jgi:lipoprotein-anchoring transpeptidase ErfK/SrfK
MTATATRRAGPNRSRHRAWAAVAAAIVALLVVAAYAVDASRSDRIAPGVRTAGIDVGGLRASAARERLAATLPAHLRQPVVVEAHGRRFTLRLAAARPRIDIRALVDRAVARSREGWFVSRAIDDVTGARTDANITTPVIYTHATVDRLADSVAARVDRPVRDAAVKPSINGLRRLAEHDGLHVARGELRAQLARAVTHPGSGRTIVARTSVTHPKVTRAQLSARYAAYIVVDRAHFRLKLYRHLKLARTYAIAVGMQGLETPPGLYDVQWKQVNPPWLVPNSPWAGSLAGRTIPPGPQDPLKARFLAFNGGAGIHGIDPSEYGSIGHNASHGCVRMTIPDVIDLYRQVPVHSPVFIA